MVVTREMELYVTNCLAKTPDTGLLNLESNTTICNAIADDDARKEPFLLKLRRFVNKTNLNFGANFQDVLEANCPNYLSSSMFNLWQERLECYMENEDDDLDASEWESLKEAFQQFPGSMLKGETSNDSIKNADGFAENAIEAIKLMKQLKSDVENAFSSIFYEDIEVEIKRILDEVVSNAVLLSDGGRPFKRLDVVMVDPMDDLNFNRELYNFASADQILPDAPQIPWLPSQTTTSKLLPRDIVQRLSSPLKTGDINDYDDWEFSITHSIEEEKDYEDFKWTYQQYRKNLKDVFKKEIENTRGKVASASPLDPKKLEEAKRKMENGDIDIDFESLFVLPYDVNQSKLIAVRDGSEGNMMTYKEVLKPPSERIMDKNLRSDPEAWVDPERAAGPHVRTFGWEPFADLHEDCPPDETEMIKKKENPDVCAATELNKTAKQSMLKRIESLKNELAHEMDDNAIANPELYEFLQRRGEQFGLIPKEFKSPETFLDSLDLPDLRTKDDGRNYPLENEIVPLYPEWLSLDGTGAHEQLTEELYWKQLQSFKKPASAPLVDWKSILNEEGSEVEDNSEKKDIERYLDEATQKPKDQDSEVVGETDWQKGEKDTPARKRALDKEFVREWVQKFGDELGIQGLDPRSFKQPEYLVSSEEYDDKFLTYPFTSSYVFHPNFVRFRRMTRNHPTYSEYTFAKYDSQTPSTFYEKNAEEFDSILAELDENGPEKKGHQFFPLNEQNLGVEPIEAKKWDHEFNAYMTEGLSLLESYAESSRKAFIRPNDPCVEEISEDLLYTEVEKEANDTVPFVKHFKCQPFVIEDFGSLPKYTDVLKGCDEKLKSKTVEKPSISKSESDDSSSDEDEAIDDCVSQNLDWRPFAKFSGYEGTNVLQLLYNASELIETKCPKYFHPCTKIEKWIEGKYQPSTGRLKEWRKTYKTAFSKVKSPLNTPYLFLSDEQRLNKLKPPVEEVAKEEGTDAWTLNEEEKIAMQNQNTTHKEEEDVEVTPDEKDENEEVHEKILKIVNSDNEASKTEWAEELDTSEAPDMSVLGTPAMTFPFELDNFQKQAIMALENGYNVFVSAHTSAGKTVVAEYAIAMSRKRRSRAIYTSPIKALSNQKYKDFKTTFDSVGLITGDVQLNETADCLIMTTEILRSMLYNSSEGIRDLEFVVLDEVHFMNDRERGHVWEEVLILLPANVQIVMLSATVPNTMDFASWVGRSKQRKVMVCKTQHRPVPLVHFFYVDVFKLKIKDASQGQFELKNGDNPLKKHEWPMIQEAIVELGKIEKKERRAIMRKFDDRDEPKKMGATKFSVDMATNRQSDTSNYKTELMKYFARKQKAQWENFINYLKQIDWLPTIVFAFSRKKCDELPQQLSLDLTTDDEKQKILSFIKSQVEKLEPEDQNLPQIRMMRKLLKNGIGVHHSGILPVLKEIVEVLFQAGIVKLLFATETFAMGVNMPARTVVFNSIDKFDGTSPRFLLPAEYIQMAGRAGRRDKDTVGNVIIRCPSKGAESLTIDKIEAMMTGSPEILKSRFRVSYRMILSTLTARSQISAINMMARSFYENKEQQKLMLRKSDLRATEEEETKHRVLIHSRFQKNYTDKLTSIYNTIEECLFLRHQIRTRLLEFGKFVQDLSPGRFIKFNCGPLINKIGIVLRAFHKTREYTVMALKEDECSLILESPPSENVAEKWYKFLALLPLQPPKKRNNPDINASLILFKISPDDVVELFKDTANITDDRAAVYIRDINLSSIGGRTKANNNLEVLCLRLDSSYLLKPIGEWHYAKELAYEQYQLLKCKEEFLSVMVNELLTQIDWPNFMTMFSSIFAWKEIVRRKEMLVQKVSEETMSLYPEYSKKMTILRRMNYVVNDSVQMKGYMAARISKYEVVVTEMLLRNVIQNLTPEEVAGLMAFIVFQPRASQPNLKQDEDEDKKPVTIAENLPALQQAIENTKLIIEEILQEESCEDLTSEELQKLPDAFGLTDIMYSWAKQKAFSKVVTMSKDFQEGMLVRWIQQLVEALKEIESAARVMGDPAVPEKILAAIKAIKRGIVFTPSLYTTL